MGTGAKYGAIALTVATTVKLARALWIVPLTLTSASVHARRSRAAGENAAKKSIAWPWFILFFLLAAVMNTYVKGLSPVYPWLSKAGRVGLTITLFSSARACRAQA